MTDRYFRSGPGDLLTAWYSYVRVPLGTHHTDRTGRLIPILPEGLPIEEPS